MFCSQIFACIKKEAKLSSSVKKAYLLATCLAIGVVVINVIYNKLIMKNITSLFVCLLYVSLKWNANVNLRIFIYLSDMKRLLKTKLFNVIKWNGLTTSLWEWMKDTLTVRCFCSVYLHKHLTMVVALNSYIHVL